MVTFVGQMDAGDHVAPVRVVSHAILTTIDAIPSSVYRNVEIENVVRMDAVEAAETALMGSTVSVNPSALTMMGQTTDTYRPRAVLSSRSAITSTLSVKVAMARKSAAPTVNAMIRSRACRIS